MDYKRAEETRKMLREIAEKVAPVSANLRINPTYDHLQGIPYEAQINTVLYDIWEDVLTIHRALQLGDINEADKE